MMCSRLLSAVTFVAVVLPLCGAPALQFPPGESWTAVRGKAATDSGVLREGRPALRVESTGADAWVRSARVDLSVGRRYEVAAWVRTEGLEVRDLDRTPVATGASLTMASMPFDVHSESLGATRDWTRLRLRFTATRARDHIVLAVAHGGAFRGKAWFSDITLEELDSSGSWPHRAAVRTFGPAYRYPTGGWIYLHIEGPPYERGYQHGFLMAREIETYLDRCAALLDAKSRQRAWDNGRSTANALFLRGFDKEILEEMKGIADGASAAGAKMYGRKVDLDDIVAANTVTELGLLRPATRMTPSGLEGLSLRAPEYFDAQRDVPVTERCSAFAATGRATAGGRMVIGHITMWSLTLAEQTNIMLDIVPTSGHRVLMQAYPGGIQSGTDYYQNDAGVVLTETTITQSPFNIQGAPVAYRARKAIQYGDNVDQVVEHLSKSNNGLYTNEWLIGDAKNDEIAMLELGTHRTKLYRSTRNEWFGGTEGFYWGCNNAKDLNVRLEYVPDPKGEPVFLPFVPSERDIKWQDLYHASKGAIDEQFAFLAFRTAPLVSSTSLDAKVSTAEMASRLMSWAVFGKPNEREWVPSPFQKEQFSGNDGIYSSGYRLIHAEANASLQAIVAENEKARRAAKAEPPKKPEQPASYKDRLWKGWLLASSDRDLWLTSGSAAYQSVLRSENWPREIDAHRSRARLLLRSFDEPLGALSSNTRSDNWARLAMHKGVLLFDALRRQLGDDVFFPLMDRFYAAHTTQTVSGDAFIRAAEEAAGKPLREFFSAWLDGRGLPGDSGGAAQVLVNLMSRLRSAIIVYGTTTEAGANRFAAEHLQKRFQDVFESRVAVRKDFAVTMEDLAGRDVVLVGRPETNSVLAQWMERLGLDYREAVFKLEGGEYGSERNGLLFAATHPLAAERLVFVVAANSALETVRLAQSLPVENAEFAVFESGKKKVSGFRTSR